MNTDRRLKIALEKSRRDNDQTTNGVVGNKFSSVLPEVYAGHPLRIERYTQYDQMDMDSEVNAALDTIADFCTQKDQNTGEIFELVYNGSQSDTEVEILKTCIHQWSKLNEFPKRFWRIFRSTLKYGDQFFIRDPETLKWYWVEQTNVEKILVNEADGKEPEAYLIRNLNLNSTNLTATQSQTYGNNMQGTGTNTMSQFGGAGAWGSGTASRAGPITNTGGRYSGDSNQLLTAVDATHVVHLSLSEGLDANWPFGISILESVFKTFRQKELLEDAVIIYRIVRAPERRIFYIDTGQMPPHKAGAYIEKVKNEIWQKRIPSKAGSGSVGTDGAYNPLSMIDDFFFAQCLSLSEKIPLVDGRILTLQQIIEEYKQGRENFVYCLDNTTLSQEQGKIIWADVTRQNARVMEITLDNGKTITSTPDHRFILSNGVEIEAQYLIPDVKLATYQKPRQNDRSGLIEKIVDSLEELVSSPDETPISHKVKTVKYLDTRIDTGDITVESPSSSHNFALDAGIYVHNSGEGRGSKVDTLPGGSSLGEISDLKWWSSKLIRGLRVPASYLPTGTEDTQTSYNDGRTGAAYIQEYRFAQYCQRLQSLLSTVFDQEFKLFVKQRGFNIDSSMFELNFTIPQHFSDFARVEKDAAMINVFQPLVELKYFSKRFLMKRYLGMTEEEITENEIKWRQENPDAVENVGGGDQAGSASSMAADAAPGIDSMGLDDGSGDEAMPDDSGDMGDAGAEPMPADNAAMPSETPADTGAPQ